MKDIQVLLNVNMSGGILHHVGKYKNYIVVIDNCLEDWNCRIIKYPYEILEENNYTDFIIWCDYEIEKTFNFYIDFDNTSVEKNEKLYQKGVKTYNGIGELEDLIKTSPLFYCYRSHLLKRL